MILADAFDALTNVGVIAGCIVSVALAAGVIARAALWASRKVAKEQQEKIGERVALEMAPVVKQVASYSEDVKQALSEFRAGDRRTTREFIAVWRTLATAGIQRHQDEGDGT